VLIGRKSVPLTVQDRARSRSIRRPQPPKWPEIHRIGHIQRQVKRAFIASLGRPLSTSQLLIRAYPRQRGPFASWQRRAVRQAAARWAVRIGRSDKGSGTPIMWLPKDKIGDHEPE
jgi:hypothetical protein